jgi:hypothetical protein
MSRVVRGLILPLALAAVLTAAAGRSAAQGFAPPSPAYNPPAVSYYYAPPAVSYYAPPAVSYYPPPTVSYYAPPAVAYYAPPAVAYYAPPAYPAATVTTRYGLFGRPRVTVAQYYAP